MMLSGFRDIAYVNGFAYPTASSSQRVGGGTRVAQVGLGSRTSCRACGSLGLTRRPMRSTVPPRTTRPATIQSSFKDADEPQAGGLPRAKIHPRISRRWEFRTGPDRDGQRARRDPLGGRVV